MGVFNWLEVRSGLPEELQDDRWQTKDVEPNFMDKLKITDTGYLLRGTNRLVEKEDSPLGIVKEPKKWVHLCNFNKTIQMIGETEDGDFVRYEAKFTNGQLDCIRKVSE